MLPVEHRMRTAGDFSDTVRSGARIGRRNVVVYAHLLAEPLPSRVGFIVSKKVGNAVTRNLVKRRLRALSADYVKQFPQGFGIVMRALPAASTATWDELSRDLHSAFQKIEKIHTEHHSSKGEEHVR
ncbi:ribonuclease P protein component [Neomicrococcus aestuarii]|uniref:Ribonuclease P protein component n=2 Tax=Neomicrococcus aestuarii TaxID=556325 RepID=A0A1L2ZNJ2_9MICC|nr:ribonuclease P protein component [Neomicrococcus aestuarii]APF40995.1 ribonuclease P protein component [Neomicrococcus aestuarii]MBB5512811.1 ribonuclease P protein component [Neomicrococcus aestuarii]